MSTLSHDAFSRFLHAFSFNAFNPSDWPEMKTFGVVLVSILAFAIVSGVWLFGIGLPAKAEEYFAVGDRLALLTVKCSKRLSLNGFRKEGSATVFDSAGQLIAQGKFHNNERDGVWLHYSGNEVHSVVFYKMGKLHGMSISVPEPGSTGRIGKYIDDKKVAEDAMVITSSTAQSENGYDMNYYFAPTSAVKEKKSVSGDSKSRMIYSRNGKLIGTINYLKNKIISVTYTHDNGKEVTITGDAAQEWEETHAL